MVASINRPARWLALLITCTVTLAALSSTAQAAGPRQRTAMRANAKSVKATKQAHATVARRKATTRAAAATAATKRSLYWGAVVGNQFTGNQAPWDMNAVTDFEHHDAAGKGQSIIPVYEAWTDCTSGTCQPGVFPTSLLNGIRGHGSIPMVNWGSQSTNDGYHGINSDAGYSLSGIIAGKYDSFLTSWATAAKQWGHPFFLRFDFEMNGNWFPWSESESGNAPGEFAAAWRHVHDIFAAAGATNATWVWCPNIGTKADGLNASLAELYPGSSYVDWTCMDAYNFGGSQGWESWSQLATLTYNLITDVIAPNKPMMIGETASTGDGGSQAQWLSQTLTTIPRAFPKIHAVIVYDQDEGADKWSMESSSASVSAFSAAINNSVFTSNTFANLGAGKIAAP